MLEKILASTRIDPETLVSFFPLDLSKCDAYRVLNVLIGLLTEGGRNDPTYKANVIAEQLRVHNPGLSSLLQKHLTLPPEACKENSMADLLVSGFNALYRRHLEMPPTFAGDFFYQHGFNALDCIAITCIDNEK